MVPESGQWPVGHFVFLVQGFAMLHQLEAAAGDVDEAEVIRRLRAQLGNTAVITVEYVEDIPVLHSQKRKYIVDEMR